MFSMSPGARQRSISTSSFNRSWRSRHDRSNPTTSCSKRNLSRRPAASGDGRSGPVATGHAELDHERRGSHGRPDMGRACPAYRDARGADGTVISRLPIPDPVSTPRLPSPMFTPFVTTKAQGMGMGLSICKTIVEQHGGQLTASSNPPRGAMLTIALPRANAI